MHGMRSRREGARSARSHERARATADREDVLAASGDDWERAEPRGGVRGGAEPPPGPEVHRRARARGPADHVEAREGEARYFRTTLWK